MKKLLSKEHYCYKIHALLMKSSAYPLSIDNPLIESWYIYADLTVMTLWNLNHLWIKHAELCLKGTFIKASFMTVCSYHVTYAFQIESILNSCLYVKELLAKNRRDISILSDCNRTWTHNHMVHKGTLNHLAKQASFMFVTILFRYL